MGIVYILLACMALVLPSHSHADDLHHDTCLKFVSDSEDIVQAYLDDVPRSRIYEYADTFKDKDISNGIIAIADTVYAAPKDPESARKDLYLFCLNIAANEQVIGDATTSGQGLTEQDINDVQLLAQDAEARKAGPDPESVSSRYSIELEGSKRLVELGAATDEETAIQRELLEGRIIQPDQPEGLFDLEASTNKAIFREAVFNRIREKAQAEIKAQSLLETAGDVASTLFNPISSIQARVGNVSAEEVATVTTDRSIFNFTEKFKEEIVAIRKIKDDEEFVRRVESLYESIKEDSAFFGVNRLRVLEVLDEMFASGPLTDEREVFTLTNFGVLLDAMLVVFLVLILALILLVSMMRVFLR